MGKRLKQPKERVRDDQFYSINRAVRCTKLKSRAVLAMYVKRYLGASWSTGKVWRKKFINPKTGNTSYRYVIAGEWIKEFNKRYNSGRLTIHKKTNIEPVRYTLDDIRGYCREHKIYTIEKFLEVKQHEENEQAKF